MKGHSIYKTGFQPDGLAKSSTSKLTRRSRTQIWGAHAPPRAHFGASPKYSFLQPKESRWRGANDSTRGRVRSPEKRSRGRPSKQRELRETRHICPADRDFVNIGPLEHREEIAVTHFNWSSASPIVRKNVFQRGSPCRFARSGSRRMPARPPSRCRRARSSHSKARSLSPRYAWASAIW